MIFRLSLNEMDLQRGEQILDLFQRQPDHLRRIFSSAAAALQCRAVRPACTIMSH